MNKSNAKTLRYIAGGLFAAELVMTLISAITGSFSFWTVLALAAGALMVAAMFTEKYVLLAVGAGLRISGGLYSVVMALRALFGWIDSDFFAVIYLFLSLASIFTLASWIPLLLAVFKRDKAKTLCFASAGLRAGNFVATLVAYIAMSIRVTGILRLILTTLLACGSIVLAGISMQTGEKSVTARPAASAAPAAAPAAVDTTTRIDKLMKLKALLDNGVLTQEEFDAKKQELLNM